MSVNRNGLWPYLDPIQVTANEGIASLNDVKKKILELSDEYLAQVIVFKDELTSGSVPDAETIPCLVAYCEGHDSDYYKFCITCSRQDNTCIYEIFIFGSSFEMSIKAFNANMRVFEKTSKKVIAKRAKNNNTKLTAKAVNAWQEEGNWYSLFEDILAEIFLG